MTKPITGSWRYRTAVFARTGAAIVGGYVLAWGMSLWTVEWSQLQGREAASLINMVFFLYYAVAIVCVFARNSLLQALTGLVVCNGLVWGCWSVVKGVAS